VNQKLMLMAALLVAAPGFAQDLELDLSGDDRPEIANEFKPSIAILSVKAADTEEVSVGRAKLLEAELVKVLTSGEHYSTVMDSAGARLGLGADFAKVDACTDFACLEAAARKLKVHRLVRLTVQKHGAGSMVTMYGYDPGFPELLVVSQESGEKAEKTFLGVQGKSQSAKDKEFLRKMSGFLNQVQKTLSIANGKITIDNADPSAVVTVEGTEGGVGSMEIIAQRGSKTVKVTAAGYKPFEQAVTVEPGKVVEVKVTLVAIPVEVAVVKIEKKEEPSVFTKPGLYLAIVGAGAVAAGVILGQQAMSVKSKVEAGGDPVGLTRAEAKTAPTNALLSNIFVAGGAAAVAGGVTWILVTLPPPAPKVPVKTNSGEPTETNAPTPGAMINFGGSF